MSDILISFLGTKSHDVASNTESYSCLEDFRTIPRKIRNLRKGCLGFDDQPKKTSLDEGKIIINLGDEMSL